MGRGTRAGGLKSKAKLLAREPGYFQRIGALGGAKSRGGGFTGRPDLARVAGAVGGRISKPYSVNPKKLD